MGQNEKAGIYAGVRFCQYLCRTSRGRNNISFGTRITSEG